MDNEPTTKPKGMTFEDHVKLMDEKHPDWLKPNATSNMAVAREFWDAALAAERDRIWREAPNHLDIQEAVVAKLNLVSREQELEQQLAAERTNAKMYCDENIKLRGKVCKCEVIHRHAETIELLKQQLDAEQEKHREELQAEIHERNRGWSNYRESQLELAAERKKLAAAVEALESLAANNCLIAKHALGRIKDEK